MIPSIINMGGAQMYIRNKVVWLRKQGWDVDVISVHKGNIIISELKEFNTFISEMQFPVYLFSEKRKNKILTKLVEKIRPNDFYEIIIESTCIGITTWAEVIAKKIGAKHLVYLLQEMNVVDNIQLQEYFKFKHKRKELVSITDHSLKQMFEGFYPIPSELSYTLPAYCNNVVEDIDSQFLYQIDWERYDYKVGCLSRIDKPYIMTAVTNFAKFAQCHNNKRFLLFMIGGAPENSQYADNIRKVFDNIGNVELVISGYIFPVPAKLLECFDAFFSSAGSCWPCMRSGVPTISIDGNDFMPTGIMKHTTLHSLFRGDDEPALDYQRIFEEVIINKKYKKFAPEHEINEPDFTEHMDFLNASQENLEHYDLDIRNLTLSEKKLKVALSIIGASNYMRLGLVKSRLLNKTTADR